MIACREACCGTIAIGVLVAAAVWVAEHSQLVDHGLSSSTASDPHGNIASISRMVWSPQGDRLLTLNSGATNSGSSLVLYDLSSGCRELQGDFDRDSISSLSIAPDGRHALIGTYAGRLWWIDLDSDEETVLISLRSGITAAALSRNGRLAAIADDLGRVILCPTPSETESSATTGEHESAGETVCSASKPVILAQNLGTSSCDIQFSESGDRLLWAGNDGSLRLWDLQTGSLLQTFRECRNVVTAAVFLPGNDRIMSASRDDTIRIWDVPSGRETWRGQFGCFGVNTLALSPDGKTAAWGGFNQRIHVWDVEQGQMAFVIDTPASIIWDLQFSPDGKSLAVAGREGTLRLYDAKSGDPQRAMEKHVM